MKRLGMMIVAVLVVCLCWTGVFAGTDDYLGDTAIYVGNPTDRPLPNILFLIDNSYATLNTASGKEYTPWEKDADGNVIVPNVAHVYPSAGFDPWTIYASDNQGRFTTIAVSQASSTDSTLSNLVCTANGDYIRTTLLTHGTYSGSGTATFPNLMGGDCHEAPKGSVYALGNYLNYLRSVEASPTDTIVTHLYTTYVKERGHLVAYTLPRKFLLTRTHVADATNEPVRGGDWQLYWSILSETDPRPDNGAWASGSSYSLDVAFVGASQRKIIFEAIKQVTGGLKSGMNFAAMTYGANNQGGKLVFGMANLTEGSNFNNFIAAIPGEDGSGTLTGEPLLSSVTNRPLAEALYDAGHYFDILNYPGISQSVTETAQIPSADKNPCGNNHIILITNGLPNTDGGSASNLGAIGDADGDGWPDEAVYGAGSHYLDDVSYWLNENTGITVHTVLAFQARDELVAHAANPLPADKEDPSNYLNGDFNDEYIGPRSFYNAYDAQTLTNALIAALSSAFATENTAFVAPVVPASTTNRTVSSNRVYLGLFMPQTGKPWFGNLKKYKVSTSNSLLGMDGSAATTSDGDFIETSHSFWGTDASGTVIKSAAGDRTLSQGDGGIVAAGGVGGTLLTRDIDLANATTRRKIYTYPPGSASTDLTNADNAFLPGNANITATLLGVADNTKKDQLISYMHGFNAYSINPTAKRSWILGDILHSKPLVFSYAAYQDSQENDCSYNKSVVYVGANDGMLHAFNDCDGSEKWAFIPPRVLGNLKEYPLAGHTYFVDSPSTAYVHDVNGNGTIETGDKVLIIFGLRRGGGTDHLTASDPRGAYYILDVTNPDVPVLKNEIASVSELGETWGQPRIAKVRVGTATKLVTFVGAGYDNNEDLRFGSTQTFPDLTSDATDATELSYDGGFDGNGDPKTSSGTSAQHNPRGRGVLAIEIAQLNKTAGVFTPDFTDCGTVLWSYTNASNSDLTFAIPSDVMTVDLDADGFADRVYAGDTGGRMWRFDISNIDTAQWGGNIIFSANPGTELTPSNGRKIFYQPAVSMIGGHPVLFFGTGDRAHPLNMGVVDRLYSVRDLGQATADAISESSLVDLTANTLQAAGTTTEQIETILNALTANSTYGWKIDLSEHTGEKVLAPPTVFKGSVFFTTYTPLTSIASPCDLGNLGVSRLYHLNYTTGEAVYNYNVSNDSGNTNERAQGDGGAVLDRSDRVKTLGEGIPSGIVTMIDASGKITMMISSSNKVGTYTAPDAKLLSPVYWIEW